MSAFWKKEDEIKNSNKSKTEKSDKAVSVKKSSKKSKKGDKGLVIPADKAALINKSLVKPMISEAVMNAQELGKYTFQVTKRCTKNEIALAIEALYKVSVEKVNVMNYKPKSRIFRGKKGATTGYKKAIITLKKGDTIKLFS